MRKRPTLGDVARAAGVSKTTASLTVNSKGADNIPPATRERVLAAVRELGYRPHGPARALSRRRAEVLGIVTAAGSFVHESQHHFELGLLSAVFRRSLERGYNPMIYDYPPGDKADNDLTRYLDGRSDAFLLLNPRVDGPLIPYLHRAGAPVVSICFRDPDPRGRWVDSDNESGIQAIVNHLAELGHERMGFFIGPPNEDNSRVRLEAFREALTRRGFPVRIDWVVPYRWNFQDTSAQMERLMRDQGRPTALLAWNDYVAEDLCRAARLIGLEVPRDLSVVGFDDTFTAATAEPPLTTVRQDLAAMGSAAVDLALECLDSDSATAAAFRVCPVELVLRQSTGPPAESARR